MPFAALMLGAHFIIGSALIRPVWGVAPEASEVVGRVMAAPIAAAMEIPAPPSSEQ